ncbi:MAG: transcriptional repressor [Anaerolineaceae bacterium]|nr:transcriptional repressor [Anaerolineaceae bacterium]
MTDSEIRYQTMLSKLKHRGSRLTSVRLALLRLIAVSEGHPDAAQLYRKLLEQFPTVSLATIYKTLTLLKEEGEILEIDLHGSSRYDGNKPYPHPHMICNQCEKIIDDEEIIFIQETSQKLKERYGFNVEHSQIVFYGLCKECKKE